MCTTSILSYHEVAAFAQFGSDLDTSHASFLPMVPAGKVDVSMSNGFRILMPLKSP